MSAITLPKHVQWLNWRDKWPAVRAALWSVLRKEISIDPVRVFDRVYALVVDIFVAALCVSFSSALLLYLYSTGDMFWTGVGILVTVCVWLFSAYRLGRSHAAAFGLLLYWTILAPVALCLTAFHLSPYWTFVNWWNGGAGPVAFTYAFIMLFCFRLIYALGDLVILLIADPNYDNPTTPRGVAAFNKRQYRRAQRSYLRSIETTQARRLRHSSNILVSLLLIMSVLLPILVIMILMVQGERDFESNLINIGIGSFFALFGVAISQGIYDATHAHYARLMGLSYK